MPKGKKTCKSCGKGVGLRAAKCDCGFEFTKKEKEVTEKPEVLVNRNDLMQVYTPGTGAGGKMSIPLIPVKPDGLDNIPEWIQKCQKAGDKLGLNYTLYAIRYMARQIWRDKDELKQALAAVTAYFDKQNDWEAESIPAIHMGSTEHVADMVEHLKPVIDWE